MSEYFEVGCRKCGEGGGWKISTDGEGHFKAEHKCGYVSEFAVVKQPDAKAIDMRLMT